MDFRALAELVMFSTLGLSVFVVAVGLSVRLFLAPTLRELFGKPTGPEPKLLQRLSHVEDRLDSIDSSLERLADGRDFDRALDEPQPRLVEKGE